MWTSIGFLGAVLVVFGSWDSRLIPLDHPLATFGHAMLGSEQGSLSVDYAALSGTALMTFSWLALWRVRSVARWRAVVPLWGLPLVFALPSISFDLFNYVEQGWAVLQGRNPYVTPMGEAGNFADYAGPWAGTTVGYPPLALSVQAALVWLAGASPFWSLIAMKFLGIAGLASAALAYKLADLRSSGPTIQWALFANPAVLIHVLGDGHNDALAGGLAVLGVAIAARLSGVRGLLLGAFIVGLAGAIKQPVLVFLFAVVVLAISRSFPGKWTAFSFWQRWQKLLIPGVAAGAVGLLAFMLPAWLTGWGLGWANATGLSGFGRSTPLRFYYEFLSHQWLNLSGHLFPRTVPEAYPQTAMVLVVLVGLCVLVRWGSTRPVEATLVAFSVYVLLGRTVQPWYVLWFLFAVVFVKISRQRALLLVGLSVWSLGALWVRPWAPLSWYSQFTWALWLAVLAMALFWLLSSNEFRDNNEQRGRLAMNN